MVQPLHIRGAKVWDGNEALVRNEAVVRDLFTDGERIAAERHSKAVTVDLDGYTIFPGLINAHDHLELNHYPRSKFRDKYDNAHQWGEDMNARLNDEPYKSLRAYPLEDRCFIGGLKNLLCGATTVAHHNPPHKCLFRKDFPVRVLKNYGWSHSLHFNTDEEIVQSYGSTPKDWPWFIHLAEGTDEVAAGEYQRLKALGCVGKNTVFVHGVGLNSEDSAQYFDQVNGIVVCPTTNEYLLGQYPTDQNVLNGPTWLWEFMALGSDSRLTANGDLLDEMQFASQYVVDCGGWLMIPGLWNGSAAYCVTRMVTHDGASVIGAIDVGDLRRDYHADWIAIRTPDKHLWNEWEENEKALCTSRRADLALVVKGGVPQIGAPEVIAKFAGVPTVGAVLDGKPKAIHVDLAKRIHANSLKEAGLDVEAVAKGRKFSFFNHL